jgi:hypothetical protein
MPQPLGVFAGELCERASEYLDAFDKLEGNSHRAKTPYASYFLLAHSLELFLKACLAAKGLRKNILRKKGHNLLHLVEACDPTIIAGIDNLDRLMRGIHEMNRDHDFRYPSGYNLTIPRPQECLPVARQFQATVTTLVSEARQDANAEWGLQTQHLSGIGVIRWSD